MSKRIPPAIAYTASVAFEKGLSIITIPLMAIFLEPGEYGRFDVAMSLVEFVTLVLGLGLADTLIRFASTAETEKKEAEAAGELLGTGLLLIATLGLIVQLLTPMLMDVLKLKVEALPLHMLLAAATVGALIEMPLVWLRLKGKAQLFMLYTMGRATLQALTTWLMLVLGFGISGVMIGNSIILLSYAAFLVWRQWRLSPPVITRRSLRRVRVYGLPLVGAALAMFAVGNANRLFLPGHVSDAEIAHFGIASRLALATSLLFYPFELWWLPQRIRVLGEPDGLSRSAATWGLGFSIVMISALAVALAGPTFIALVLPAGYEPAALLLPFLVAVQVIHYTGSLSNVGCYAKENSMEVLAIDISAAIVALAGYYFLVPTMGVWGTILAMGAAFSLRLALYLFIGYPKAPISYPLLGAVIGATAGFLVVYLAPDKSWFFSRLGWSILTMTLFALLLYRMRMIQIPEGIQQQILTLFRNVRKSG